MTTTASHGKRIIELESIRGIAALLVVLLHLSWWNAGIYGIGLIKNSYLMVEVFFVLSGFVIFRAYSRSIMTPGELARFQFLRWGRLYPVHCFFLAVFLGIEILKYIATTRFGINSPNSVPFRENNLTAFIEQFFLIQAIGPTGNMLTFNFPAWSISVEFYTYVLFGITSLVAQRKAIVVFAGFSAVSFVFLSLDILPGFHELLRCTSGFFLGCVTAAIVAAARFTVPPLATTTTLFILFTFLQWKPFLQFDEAISLLTSVLIACVVRSDRGMARAFLGSPFLVWLGTISYSVYMANGAIVWTISQVLRLVLKRPELVVEGRLTPQLSIPETLLTYAIAIPIILAVAQITYWLIEKPLRERSRAFAAAHFGGVPPLKDHR